VEEGHWTVASGIINREITKIKIKAIEIKYIEADFSAFPIYLSSFACNISLFKI